MPLEVFCDHFRNKPQWQQALDPQEGGIFLKLLKIPDLLNKNKRDKGDKENSEQTQMVSTKKLSSSKRQSNASGCNFDKQ